MKTFLHITAMTNCICLKSHGMEDGWKRNLFECLVAGYFFFQKQATVDTWNKFLTNPDVNVAIRTWNALD